MELPFKYASFSNNMGRGLTQKEIKKIIADNKEVKMKYCCNEFKNIQKWKPWIRHVKLRNSFHWVMGHPDQTGVMFIDYCPFCGKKLI